MGPLRSMADRMVELDRTNHISALRRLRPFCNDIGRWIYHQSGLCPYKLADIPLDDIDHDNPRGYQQSSNKASGAIQFVWLGVQLSCTCCNIDCYTSGDDTRFHAFARGVGDDQEPD